MILPNQWEIGWTWNCHKRLVMRVLRAGSILFAMGAVYAGQSSNVNAPEIIKKSVAATQANWKQAPKYAFVERDVTSKKNHAKTTKTFEVLMIDGSPYNKLLAVND